MSSSSSSNASTSDEVVAHDLYATGCTFLAGAIAGACSRTCTAPLDRVKIIVQEGRFVSCGSHRKLSGGPSVVDVVRLIYRDGGWRAFFRGNGVNCMKAGPEFAMVFTFRRLLLALAAERKHEELEHQRLVARLLAAGDEINAQASPFRFHLTRVPSIAVHFLIGALSGASAQFVLYPLEVIKTRIAVSTSNEFQGGVWEVASEAYRTGGIREFYKGLVPNMVGMFLFRGMEVGLYTTCRKSIIRSRRDHLEPGEAVEHSDLNVMETALLGTLASTVAQTATYPLNVVRTRMQTSGVNGRAVRCGMCNCFRELYAADGIRGLFRGLVPNYLKAAPASAITFVVFEHTQRVLLGYDD